MSITLTFQPDPAIALDLSVDGNEVELTTRETDEYGVVVTLPVPVLRAALDSLAPHTPTEELRGLLSEAWERLEATDRELATAEAHRDEAQCLAADQIAEAQSEATEAVTRAETAELRAEKAEHPRPLTADDITDEMVDRGLDALDEEAAVSVTIPTMRAVLTSALTEPPARPEGAEEIERFLASLDYLTDRETGGSLVDGATLANDLAAWHEKGAAS